MPHVNASRIKQASASAGSSDFTLGAAALGYRGYAARLADGDTAFYTAENPADPTEWETGIGTLGSGGTVLQRTTVLDGAAGVGSAVTFSNNPVLWCGLPGDYASVGALKQVDQKIASSSATLDFTGLAIYSEFELHIEGLIPATNGAHLYMQAGTGGGPTWDTGTSYNFAVAYAYPDGSTPTGAVIGGSGAGAKSTFIKIADTVDNTASEGGVDGTVKSNSLIRASVNKKFAIDTISSNSNLQFRWTGSGSYFNSTDPVTGLRLFASTGNLASGKVRLLARRFI